MKKYLVLLLIILTGCANSTISLTDFEENKDVVVMDELLTNKTNKLYFKLDEIIKKNKDFKLTYSQNDGSKIEIMYNDKQQIKQIVFFDSGKKNKSQEAFADIVTSPILDVFSSFSSEEINNLLQTYSKNTHNISFEKTIYGECVVDYSDQKFRIIFHHTKT